MKNNTDPTQNIETVPVVKENPGIEMKEEVIAPVFICDECGDTLWDKVLEQENLTGK